MVEAKFSSSASTQVHMVFAGLAAWLIHWHWIISYL